MNENKRQRVLEVIDPSGDRRILNLGDFQTIGNACRPGGDFDILLRDSLLPQKVGELEITSIGTVWGRFETQVNASLNGLSMQSFQIPENTWIHVSDSRFRVLTTQALNAKSLPFKLPHQNKQWITSSNLGTQTLYDTHRSAKTDLSVYLEGETGTGKEVLAHLVHSASKRASGPFIVLNCGALPLGLAESELFGHVKGAFTGAVNSRTGALVKAHQGTLFLDEIADLSLELQVKLLRFLENGEIKSVGSDSSAKANVRLVCATHKPLKKLVEEGKFRQDLYFRIASVTIKIPALRDRPDDIEHLAQMFCRDFSYALTPSAIQVLTHYSWPGNVRELKHAIEKAIGLYSDDSKILGPEAFSFLNDTINDPSAYEMPVHIKTLEHAERFMLLKALRVTQGNRAEAAKLLGIARSTVFEMLKRHKIDRPKIEGLVRTYGAKEWVTMTS